MQQSYPPRRYPLHNLWILIEASALAGGQIDRFPTMVDSSRMPPPPPQGSLPRPSPRHPSLTGRQSCLVFVKILLKYLGKINATTLQRRVKLVVAKCIHDNNAQASAVPLVQTLEDALCECVGQAHWTQAMLYFEAYCERRTQISSSVTSPIVAV